MQEFRPMSIPDILDTTFRLYRERFVTFLLIALIVHVPYSLLTTFILPAEAQVAAASLVPGVRPQPQIDFSAFLPGILATFTFAVIFMPLCHAALTHNISAAYLGKELSAGESYKRGAPRLAGLIWTLFLAWLVIYMGFCLVVAWILFMIWFYVVTPVVVLEGVTGPAALGRSRELVRGNLGKTALLGFLAWLMAVVIILILRLVIGLIPWPHILFRVFIQNLVGVVVLPIMTAPSILLYYDLRIRKEAFDLQMLSSAIEQPAAT